MVMVWRVSNCAHFKGHAVLEVSGGLSKSSGGSDPCILTDAPVGRADGRKGKEQQDLGHSSHRRGGTWNWPSEEE